MSKPYLASTQIMDDCGRPAADYVKLPRRFSSDASASILSGYNSSRDKPKNFIRCP